MILVIFAIVVAFFDRLYDLNALVNGIDKPNCKTYYDKALNEIHKTIDLCYVKYSYTGKVKQPVFAGWVSFVELSTRTMKLTKVQIECPVRLVCSQSYGTAGYFVSDAFLNPNFMVEDCKALFKDLKYRQYKAGHDVLLSPSDNGANISYKDVLRFLLDD
jgi:hypothetical protein